MATNPDQAVIAVDGGGTRCRLALVRGPDVTTVEAGPANATSDFAGAVAAIMDGVAALARAVDTPVDTLVGLPAYLGLAGVVDADVAQRLRAALPFVHARVAEDRPAALRGALGAGNGCLAHAGTGSFLGAQREGKMRFAGGWGPVLGDEASAQWVGRRALALTLHVVDGRRAETALAQHILNELRGGSGIVSFAAAASPSDFGALAPSVTEHALSGDQTAQEVMQAGGTHIATGLDALGWMPGTPLCLSGGIGPHFAPYLPNHMAAALTEPQGTPLDGAIALARAFATEVAAP